MKHSLKNILCALLFIYFSFPSYANATLSKNEFQALIEKAKNGDVKSQSKVGDIYNDGDGVKKSCEKAIHWYEKAAKKNHTYSQIALGIMYRKESCALESDNSKSTYWFEKAAKEGNSFAQYKVGMAYSNGYGVTINDDKAVYWLSKSANQGNADAKKLIGISIQGIEVSFDIACAAPYFSDYYPLEKEGVCTHNFTFPLVILNGRKYTSNKSTIKAQKLINASIINFLGLDKKLQSVNWNSFSNDIVQDYAFSFFSDRWVNKGFGFKVVSNKNGKITLDYSLAGYPGGNYYANYEKRYILNLETKAMYTIEDLVTNKVELLKVLDIHMNKAIIGSAFKKGYLDGAFNKNKAGNPVLIIFPDDFKVENNNLIAAYHRCSLTYCAAGYAPILYIPLTEVQAYIDLDKL